MKASSVWFQGSKPSISYKLKSCFPLWGIGWSSGFNRDYWHCGRWWAWFRPFPAAAELSNSSLSGQGSGQQLIHQRPSRLIGSSITHYLCHCKYLRRNVTFGAEYPSTSRLQPVHIAWTPGKERNTPSPGFPWRNVTNSSVVSDKGELAGTVWRQGPSIGMYHICHSQDTGAMRSIVFKKWWCPYPGPKSRRARRIRITPWSCLNKLFSGLAPCGVRFQSGVKPRDAGFCFKQRFHWWNALLSLNKPTGAPTVSQTLPLGAETETDRTQPSPVRTSRSSRKTNTRTNDSDDVWDGIF